MKKMSNIRGIPGRKRRHKMENRMFVGVEAVCKDFGIGSSKAYQIIKELNDELKNKGYITVPGRVSKQYYCERVYGKMPEERGVTDNASI